MTWMNEYEIVDAVEVFDRVGQDNLRRAAHTLRNLMRWTNSNSDGWPYWQKPSRASAKLQDLVHTARVAGGDAADITGPELKAALTPVKSFLTRQGVDHAEVIVQ